MTKHSKQEKSETIQDKVSWSDSAATREAGEGAASGEGRPLDPSDQEGLAAKLEGAEQRAAENYDKYVRTVAEFENYKKRAVREKAEAIKFGSENLLRDVLPLMDSIDRAMAHACSSDDFEAFKTGLEMLRKQLSGTLEKHGVEEIEALGKDFDPNVHDAMMQVDSGEHEQNEVVCEFEKGYLLNGRLLRPARVSVCRRSDREDS